MEAVERLTWFEGSEVERDGAGHPVNGAGFSEEVRALALELYYTDAGRNVQTLQKLIGAEPFNISVSARTLHSWRVKENWDFTADTKLVQFAPHRRRRTAEGLTVAAELAANYLIRVLSGAEKATKENIAACKLALDSSGFASVRSLDPPALGELPTLGEGSEEIGGDGVPMDASIEGAIERIRRRREGWRFVGGDDE